MTRSLGGKLNAFEWVLVTTVFALITCVALQAHATKKMVEKANIVAKHMVDLDDDESTVVRHLDCEAGVIIWVANSKTYGHAVGVAVLPIKDTLLLMREVCSGTSPDKQ